MRALVQRVTRATVAVGDECVAEIGAGLCAFIGVGHDDEEADARLLADRIVGLRILADRNGKMNLSLLQTGGELLVVSQFTLFGDTRRGRRPSFAAAADRVHAEPLVELVVTCARERGIRVGMGRFGAHMNIGIEADGPVTLMLDSGDKRGATKGDEDA